MNLINSIYETSKGTITRLREKVQTKPAKVKQRRQNNQFFDIKKKPIREKMENFLEKVTQQEALAAKIDTLRTNYKKEPKRRLKNINRLRQWMVKLEDYWGDFSAMHDELQQGREILADTEYQKTNVFENIKLKYEDMKANLRFILGSANLQTFNDMFGNETEPGGNTETKNEEEAENVASDSTDSDNEEDAANESFRTVKNVIIKESTPIPEHVKNNRELNNKVNITKKRLESKLRRFERELNIIENFALNNLKSRAKLALKDTEKLREYLTDEIDELCFMIGDAANEYENRYENLMMKYREINDEVTSSRRL